MSDVEFDSYVSAAYDALQTKKQDLEQRWGLGHFAAWSYDGSTGALQWSDRNGQARVQARVTEIGSFAKQSGTWKWAWANESIPQSRRDESSTLKELYGRTGFDVFQNAAFEADEQMAWEIAAMAVEHLAARGCYRGATPDLSVFLAIIDITSLGVFEEGEGK